MLYIITNGDTAIIERVQPVLEELQIVFAETDKELLEYRVVKNTDSVLVVNPKSKAAVKSLRKKLPEGVNIVTNEKDELGEPIDVARLFILVKGAPKVGTFISDPTRPAFSPKLPKADKSPSKLTKIPSETVIASSSQTKPTVTFDNAPEVTKVADKPAKVEKPAPAKPKQEPKGDKGNKPAKPKQPAKPVETVSTYKEQRPMKFRTRYEFAEYLAGAGDVTVLQGVDGLVELTFEQKMVDGKPVGKPRQVNRKVITEPVECQVLSGDYAKVQEENAKIERQGKKKKGDNAKDKPVNKPEKTSGKATPSSKKGEFTIRTRDEQPKASPKKSLTEAPASQSDSELSFELTPNSEQPTPVQTPNQEFVLEFEEPQFTLEPTQPATIQAEPEFTLEPKQPVIAPSTPEFVLDESAAELEKTLLNLGQ